MNHFDAALVNPSSRLVALEPMGEEGPRRPDDIDFSELLAAFRRRLWAFLITLAVTIGLVVAFLFIYPADYTATSRVAINQRTINATPSKDEPVVSQLPTGTTDVDTETQIIQSRRVAGRVVDRFNLEKDPEFNGNGVNWKRFLSNTFLVFSKVKRNESLRDRVIDAVLAKLDPERYLETNAIDINFKDKSPVRAQKYANAFAQAYLEDQVEAKAAQNRQAATALLSQIDSMRREASSDADRVQAYKIAHNLLSVGAQTMTEQEVSSYNQAVAGAKAEAAADQANLKTAQDQLSHGSTGEDVGAAIGSPTISALRAQRAALTGKLAVLESHYGPKYPDLAQARREVASIDQEIQAEILRLISNLSAKADVSQKRLASLEGTAASTQRTLAQNNAAQGGLDDLVRAATVSQEIYEAYLQRFKESTAQLASLSPDAEIVSIASLTPDPSFPVAWLFLLLAVVAGVLFGLAAVLLAEMLDRRLNTPADVRQKLMRPYLGSLPALPRPRGGAGGSPLETIISKPNSAFSEAMRGLLTSIRLGAPAGGPGVVLLTSARPGDGKTTVAGCLARTAAMRGVSTILIDCDAKGRGRGLMRDFDVTEWGPGLFEVLRGEARLEDALRRDEESGAVLLPMSDAAQTSDELMGSPAMDALLGTLRQAFGLVILDSPPLDIATTRLLAAKANSTIVLAQWRSPADKGTIASLQLPPFDTATRVGVVLNGVDLAKQERYGFGRPASLEKMFTYRYG